MIKSIFSKLLKIMFSNTIIGKPYNGTAKMLFYEKSQHLIFAFQKTLFYEAIIQEKAKKYINDGDLIFDIGGNIGQYALLFSELVGTTGKVISVEPDSKNFAFLQFNIQFNKILNTIILNTGIDKSMGQLQFYRDTETGGRRGSFSKEFVEKSFNGYTEEVSTMTFDFLIEKYGIPSFVKIDVEGYEFNVLAGLSLDLDKTTFLVEVRSETKDSVFDYFNSKSYKCYCIDEKEDVLIEKSVAIPAIANLIFIK